MICYKDITFCEGKDVTCMKWSQCPRALTDKVYDDARRWWGKDGAPIAFVKVMDCYESPELMESENG